MSCESRVQLTEAGPGEGIAGGVTRVENGLATVEGVGVPLVVIRKTADLDGSETELGPEIRFAAWVSQR